jgi:peptidyl-prolyl cis-trans isomerase A (cyclophilin A)
MRHKYPVIALLLALIAPVLAQSPAQLPQPAPAAPSVDVVMTTALGPIRVQLDLAHAPITAANFLRYVDQKRFDDTNFYRAVQIGDSSDYGLAQAGLRGNPKRLFKPIAHESTAQTGLSHLSGAISMARAEPGTATADYFIVQGDLTGLDATAADPGYAVFGRVTEGMELVRAMIEMPRAATAPVEAMKGQMLATPVKILTVRRASPQPAAPAAATASSKPAAQP